MAIMDYNYGLQSAEERGEKRGEERLGKLMGMLKEAGRESEAFEAAANPEKRNALYREFGLFEDERDEA